ncbi:MAG: hypothetical protein RXO22_07280 [Thermocladium sp.]|jgi:hypothetical protein
MDGSANNGPMYIRYVISRPRRLRILKAIYASSKSLVELEKELNIPLSILLYDIETMRLQGLVTRIGSNVLLTDRGRNVVDALRGMNIDEEKPLGSLHKLINYLSLRPIGVYLHQVESRILLIYSLLILALSSIIMYMSGIKLLFLLPTTDVFIPQYVTIISIILFIIINVMILRILMPLHDMIYWVTYSLASLIPLFTASTIYSLAYILGLMYNPLIAAIVYTVSYLSTVVSISLLSTLVSLETSLSTEIVFTIYVFVMFVPNVLLYLILSSSP